MPLLAERKRPSEKPSTHRERRQKKEGFGPWQYAREFFSRAENGDLIGELREIEAQITLFNEAPEEGDQAKREAELSEAIDHVVQQIQDREKDFGKTTTILREVSERFAKAWGMDEELGRSIAQKYLLTSRVGKGGEGEVFSARAVIDPEGEEDIVKIVRKDISDINPPSGLTEQEFEAELVKPVVDEMQHMAQISNRHVMKVFGGDAIIRQSGLGLREAESWYAMPKAEGSDLMKRMQKDPMTLEQGLDIAAQVVDGLRAVHEKGIVHRDVKPQNIFLKGKEHPQAIIGDFGIATLEDLAKGQAIPEEQAENARYLSEQFRRGRKPSEEVAPISGTPAYASPEQLLSAPITPKSDMFSLGAVLFRTFAGRDAFVHQPKEVFYVVADRIINEPAPVLSDYRPDLPPELSTLVSRMLDKDPSKRPSDDDAYLRLKNILHEVKSSTIRNKLLEAYQEAAVPQETEKLDMGEAFQDQGFESEAEQTSKQPQSPHEAGEVDEQELLAPHATRDVEGRSRFQGDLPGFLQMAVRARYKKLNPALLKNVFVSDEARLQALATLEKRGILKRGLLNRWRRRPEYRFTAEFLANPDAFLNPPAQVEQPAQVSPQEEAEERSSSAETPAEAEMPNKLYPFEGEPEAFLQSRKESGLPIRVATVQRGMGLEPQAAQELLEKWVRDGVLHKQGENEYVFLSSENVSEVIAEEPAVETEEEVLPDMLDRSHWSDQEYRELTERLYDELVLLAKDKRSIVSVKWLELQLHISEDQANQVLDDLIANNAVTPLTGSERRRPGAPRGARLTKEFIQRI